MKRPFSRVTGIGASDPGNGNRHAVALYKTPMDPQSTVDERL
jgi:hypothetical protein